MACLVSNLPNGFELGKTKALSHFLRDGDVSKGKETRTFHKGKFSD